MTSLLFIMVLLFSYIGWHLGYEGFIIVGDVNVPDWLNRSISAGLLFINLSLVGSFIIGEYSVKIFKFIIPLIILSVLNSIFFMPGLISGPVATIYFVVIGVLRKTSRESLVRAVIITGITVIYQILAMSMRTGSISLNPTYFSIYTALMLSIDMILVILLIWAYGGVKYVRRMEFLVYPGRTRDERSMFRIVESEAKSSEPVSEKQASSVNVGGGVTKFERLLFGVFIIVVQVAQWMFILWVCSRDNLFLEALVMTTSFICHGMIISKRKHLKPIILCTLGATAMFHFAARFSISFHHSQFFPIIIGLILVYTLYRVSHEFEKTAKKKLEHEQERINKLKSRVDNAWRELERLSRS